MKTRKVKAGLMLLLVGSVIAHRVLAESWSCASGGTISGNFVTSGVDVPDSTTAVTWVRIGSGGSSDNRSYSWRFKFRNNDNAPASCQTLSSGTTQSTTGLYKENTWLRTSYAWGSTFLECTTSGALASGVAIVKGVDYCPSANDCF